MAIFVNRKSFTILIAITTLIYGGMIWLYSWSEIHKWNKTKRKDILNDINTWLPYVLSLFELITSVGFAIIFCQLYHELKMLSEKTFAKIRYKTMTYLTLITMLTNTRFLYNLVLLLNN